MTDFAGARKPTCRVLVGTRSVGSSDPLSPVTRELSEYVAAALARPLPAEVAEKTQAPPARHARRHGLGLASAAGAPGDRVRPGPHGGRRQATVVGSRNRHHGRSTPRSRTASGAHADETDDLHIGGRFHPGCAAAPAALAAAELAERDGASLLGAVALGYDVGARFVMALGLSRRLRPAAQHPQPGRPLRRGGCGRGAARPRHASANRASSCPTSCSRPRASPFGCAIRATSRRRSTSAACRRATRFAAATMAAAGFTGVEDPRAGPRTSPRGVRRGAAARGPGRLPWQRVRDHAGVDQEVARGRADPGRARCPRDPDAQTRYRRRATSRALLSACPTTGPSWSTTSGEGAESVRAAPAGGAAAGRRARLSCRARPGAHARPEQSSRCAGACASCRMSSSPERCRPARRSSRSRRSDGRAARAAHPGGARHADNPRSGRRSRRRRRICWHRCSAPSAPARSRRRSTRIERLPSVRALRPLFQA